MEADAAHLKPSLGTADQAASAALLAHDDPVGG
jgi:hypothetical protein